MWNYEKRLQHPVKIKQTNAELAKVIITQFGGPDGELAASMRYLSQRYDTPYRETAALLTDIGGSVPKLPLSFGNRFFIHKKDLLQAENISVSCICSRSFLLLYKNFRKEFIMRSVQGNLYQTR
jgi:spore coat protein JC